MRARSGLSIRRVIERRADGQQLDQHHPGMLRVFRLQFADDMGGAEGFTVFRERNLDGGIASVAWRNDFEVARTPTQNLLREFREVA